MGVLMYDPGTSAAKRSLQIAGLGAGYLLFISAFAWGFDAWWMLPAFAWLCFSKIQAIWTGAERRGADRLNRGDRVPVCAPARRDARGARRRRLQRGRRRLGGRTAPRAG